MEDWQQRVIDEKTQLDERLQKLEAFINTDAASVVSVEENQRLIRQQQCMNDYAQVLQERIEAWG
jgi:hypothetical protein